jgi:exonuclease III
MRGLTWNCRGIRKKGVTSFLRNLILEQKFHVIALQETMQECIEEKTIRNIDPGQTYLWKWIPSRARSGGILSRINIDLYDVGSFF